MATVSHFAIGRRRIQVRGIVQGVGFRPFVYKLANDLGVGGFILNTSSGVTIEVEGDEAALDRFLQLLQSHPPPLANVQDVSASPLEPLGIHAFEIRESEPRNHEFALISPDVAICADCRREVGDPQDRRFGYSFTNCTNCGPRYTIIQDIPYDRPMTTMAGFRMCNQCEAEYHDPANRRFHAQPNACPQCGPSITLTHSGSGIGIDSDSRSALATVRRLLRDGEIVGVKGLGGFQFACDAQNDSAVRALRTRKKRSDKPFALMVRGVDSAEEIAYVTEADRKLLLSPAHPIVILRRRSGGKIATDVAPGNDTIGVMLAYTPLHLFLFGERFEDPSEFMALVMTSGNLSDEPIVIANQEASEHLAGVAGWFLTHNRDIYMRVDDSVARTFAGSPRILRRSRGYAPHPIDLGYSLGELLACGAELKSTFCLTKGQYAILSQHIGDLENYETLEFFKETLANLSKLFRVSPQAVAHDLHPQYMSSRFAADLSLPKIGVQHHHAHIASCMADNGLRGKVMGIAFDGTGYGVDGHIWGGEFMTADFVGFDRRAHFRYVPMPGGDTAVRQPWRMALSWLRESFGSSLPAQLPLFRNVPEREVEVVSRMIARGINTSLTSSCGRLFDAVASLIGLRHEVTFEGQAAIELETASEHGIDETYPFEIDSSEPAQIDMRPAIREIVSELLKGRSRSVIASRFHNTIALIVGEMCRRIRSTERLTRVCLSGGTFQNVYLAERCSAVLEHLGFEVFLHKDVPPNDGGISLGQAVIANETLKGAA